MERRERIHNPTKGIGDSQEQICDEPLELEEALVLNTRHKASRPAVERKGTRDVATAARENSQAAMYGPYDELGGPSTGRKASVSLMLFRETGVIQQDSSTRGSTRPKLDEASRQSSNVKARRGSHPSLAVLQTNDAGSGPSNYFDSVLDTESTSKAGERGSAAKREQQSLLQDFESLDLSSSRTGTNEHLSTLSADDSVRNSSNNMSSADQRSCRRRVTPSEAKYRMKNAENHTMEFERTESEADYASSSLSTFTSDSASSEDDSVATENEGAATDLEEHSLEVNGDHSTFDESDNSPKPASARGQQSTAQQAGAQDGEMARPLGESAMNESDVRKEYPLLSNVELRPFHNQVGGHSSMFRMGRRAVCKPLVRQENAFYEKLEQTEGGRALLCFVPQYLGVLNVTYKRRTAAGSDDGSPERYSDGEQSVPQVTFDHNKHIIPGWMMALSQSRTPVKESGKQNTMPSYRRRIRQSLQTQESVEDRPPSLDLSEMMQAKNRMSRTRRRNSSNPSLSGTQSDPDDTVRSPRTLSPRSIELSPKKHSADMTPHVSPLNTPPAYARSASTSIGSGNDGFINRIRGLGTTVVNRRLKEQVLREVFAPRSASPRSTAHKLVHQLSSPSLPPKARIGPERHRRLSSSSDTKVGCSSRSTPQRSRGTSPFRDASIPTVPENDALFQFDDIAEDHADDVASKLVSADEPGHLANEDERCEQFILMEDLSGRLRSPCVLDLKMGTRQYGIDATDAKKTSQTKKCMKTTSGSLGVRLCGMQIFKTSTRKYLFQDKYYGRSLTTKDFQRALGGFLDNGTHMLVHHVPVILRKLHRLAEIVFDLKGYRFYASSLLFLYDGDEAAQISQAQLQADNRQEQVRNEAMRQSSTRSTPASPVLAPFVPHSHCHRGEMNIKIIDFAHCATGDPREFTESDWRFPPQHAEEPDMGYLWGLRNLCESFCGIWQEELNRRMTNARGPKRSDTILGHGGIVEDQDMLNSIADEGKAIWTRIFAKGVDKGRVQDTDSMSI